jgi:hypothetical protein
MEKNTNNKANNKPDENNEANKVTGAGAEGANKPTGAGAEGANKPTGAGAEGANKPTGDKSPAKLTIEDDEETEDAPIELGKLVGYQTSDGNVFHKHNDALNHSLKLQDKGIETVYE